MLNATWDELIVRAEGMSGLTAEERRAAASAFVELRALLGDQFLSPKHPLYYALHSGWIWRFKWVSYFAKLLASLKDHPDFAALIRDLSNPAKFEERLSVIEVMAILLAKGFQFELDKGVHVHGKLKEPDLFVHLGANNPGIFVEVSFLSPGHQEVQANHVFYTIQDVFRREFPQLEFSGRCQRVLSKVHLEHVIEKLRAAASTAATQTGFEAVELEGVIHLALATQANEAKLRSWAAKYHLEVGEFVGPAADTSEIPRLSTKLQDKQKQLAQGNCNVIVIYSHLFCQSPGTPEMLDQLAQSLEEEIYRYPHVAYVVLIFRWLGGHASQGFSLREHVCVNRKRFDLLCDSTLLFKNRFAATPMPKVIEDAFVGAFQASPHHE